jgi:hemoglobin
MSEPTLPVGLIQGRHTPLFDFESLPHPLVESHRTTVWAELLVQSGSVRFVDLEGESPRDLRIEAGDSVVIAPGVEHQVEPSSDATFFLQFYREPGADMIPGLALVEAESARGSGPWEHRGCDLDTPEEIFEMVTRQYADVVQDDLLQPYFNFGPGFIDWQSHIGSVTDYWCHVLLFAPGYEIDVIQAHRHLHDEATFTPELFDRWLQVFHDTVDGGWTGPLATAAHKRAIGTTWAMAHRFLGAGVWVHPDLRS